MIAPSAIAVLATFAASIADAFGAALDAAASCVRAFGAALDAAASRACAFGTALDAAASHARAFGDALDAQKAEKKKQKKMREIANSAAAKVATANTSAMASGLCAYFALAKLEEATEAFLIAYNRRNTLREECKAIYELSDPDSMPIHSDSSYIRTIASESYELWSYPYIYLSDTTICILPYQLHEYTEAMQHTLRESLAAEKALTHMNYAFEKSVHAYREAHTLTELFSKKVNAKAYVGLPSLDRYHTSVLTNTIKILSI